MKGHIFIQYIILDP